VYYTGERADRGECPDPVYKFDFAFNWEQSDRNMKAYCCWGKPIPLRTNVRTGGYRGWNNRFVIYIVTGSVTDDKATTGEFCYTKAKPLISLSWKSRYTMEAMKTLDNHTVSKLISFRKNVCIFTAKYSPKIPANNYIKQPSSSEFGH